MLSWIFSMVAFVASFLPSPTYREGIIGQPNNLNPLELSTNQPDRDIARFIHRGLMKYDTEGNLVPDLAESYKVSPDQKEYTFSLHKNVHWQDGNLFTADDVIETIAQQNLQVVEADKLDDFTVRLRLIKDPYSPLLDFLTQYIVPAAYKRKSQSGLNVVGLGDFRVARIKKSARVEAVYLTRAWPWQKNNSHFSRIIFKYYSNQKELETAARLGEIDAYGSTSVLKTITSFRSISAPVGSRYYALFFNLEKDPYKQKELRHKLQTLLPLDQIIDGDLNGAGVPAYGPLEYTFVDPQPVKPTPRAPEKLANTIDQVLVLTVPEFSSKTPAEQNLTSVTDSIKTAWEKGGFNVEIKKVPIDSIFNEVIAKKNFGILLFGQEVERDPDVYTLWHSAQISLPGLNFVSYKSPLADRALEDGRKSLNLEERKSFYQRFLKVFSEDTPAIFLYHPLYFFAAKDYLTGPSLAGFFKIADRFNNFNQWQFTR